MGRIGTLALAGALLTLAGCASEATTPVVQPAPAVVTSALSLTLNPWMNSGESGAVTFVPLTATSTQVQVQFTGTPGPHEGFLHVGSCQNMGAVVAQLGTLSVPSSGTRTGTLTENVAIPLSVLRDGNHFIAFHQAYGTPGNAVACTDIPAM